MKITITSPNGVRQHGRLSVTVTGTRVKVAGSYYDFEQLLELGFTIRKADKQ